MRENTKLVTIVFWGNKVVQIRINFELNLSWRSNLMGNCGKIGNLSNRHIHVGLNVSGTISWKQEVMTSLPHLFWTDETKNVLFKYESWKATLLKFNTLGFSSIPGYTRVQGEEIFNDGFLNWYFNKGCKGSFTRESDFHIFLVRVFKKSK